MRRRGGGGAGAAPKAVGSAVELSKKILGQSKMTTSKMSGTGDSQSGANQPG